MTTIILVSDFMKSDSKYMSFLHMYIIRIVTTLFWSFIDFIFNYTFHEITHVFQIVVLLYSLKYENLFP